MTEYESHDIKMPALDAARAELDALEAESYAYLERSDVTADEVAGLADRLESARAKVAQLERVASFARTPANVRTEATDRAFTAPNINTRTDPFDLAAVDRLHPDERANEVRARAIDIVTTDRADHLDDASRESIVRRLEERDGVSRQVAELVARTGSAEYRDAFESYVRDPASLSHRLYLEQVSAEVNARAALGLTAVDGSLMPYQLDPTLTINNTGTVSPIRQVARVVTSSVNEYRIPSTTGITSAVLAEGVEVSDNTPTFSSTSIYAWKMAGYGFGSFEAIADANLAPRMAELFADSRARLEAQLLVTGTGSSQPQGIVTFCSNTTSVVAGSSGAANSADLVADDIYSLRANLSPRWRANASWLGNLAVAHSIRKLGTSTNFHAFSLDLTQSSDQLYLLGRPFYEVSDMDGTIVSGSTDFVLIHGDMSNYVIVDRIGSTLLYQPIVTGASGRPTGQAGWLHYWRFGAGASTDAKDAFRLMKV